MNKNRKEKTMRCRTTPMNLNQGTNEESRKTHKSINHKSIQKSTSLNRNGVQVGDRPDRMTRNLEKKNNNNNKKKQIMELNKLMGGDMRINTPQNGSTGEI